MSFSLKIHNNGRITLLIKKNTENKGNIRASLAKVFASGIISAGSGCPIKKSDFLNRKPTLSMCPCYVTIKYSFHPLPAVL